MNELKLYSSTSVWIQYVENTQIVRVSNCHSNGVTCDT